MRWITAAALAIVLSACGGGGSSNSETSNPPPSASSLSLPGTQISVSTYVNNLAPLPAALAVTILNPPSSKLTYRVISSGMAVSSADFSWQSVSSGTLNIHFPSPATLGAGTFQGSVQLSVCSDAACLQPIGDSPATLMVTYTVNPGSQPPTSFTLMEGPQAIASALYTSQTDPILVDFALYVTNLPSSGLWVIVTQPSSGFVVSAGLAPYSGPSAVVGLTLKSPAQLGSGLFNGSVTFQVCYDEQCQNPVQGSPVVEPLTFAVSLSAGLEYAIKNVSIPGITDVGWNSANQQLYATTLTAGNWPQSLLQIDPTAGTVGSSLSLGVDLYHLALSDDGQDAYVASRDQPTVYRVELPSLVSDLQIPLGSTSMGANSVYQMQVAPGTPQILAVSFSQGGSTEYTAGVAVFDGATERTNLLPELPDFGTPAEIAWSSSSSVLYAVRYTPAVPTDLLELDVVNANASGLSLGTAFPISLSDALGSVWYAAGRLYGTDGNIRDPSTNTILAQYVVPDGYQISTLVPDAANNRIFVLAHAILSGHLILFCYDATTLALRSVTDLGYDMTPAYPLRLITWGTNGIAFTSGENTLVVLSGSFQNTGSSGTSSAKTTLRLRVR